MRGILIAQGYFWKDIENIYYEDGEKVLRLTIYIQCFSTVQKLKEVLSRKNH